MQADIVDQVGELLTPVLPAETARAIVSRLRREWGGDSCYIKRVDRQARDSAIRRGLAAGRSANAIAVSLGISRESVRRVKSN